MKKFYGKLCYNFLQTLFGCLLIQGLIFPQATNNNLPPRSEQIIPELNFKDTDIRDILRSISYNYKTNIVIENTLDAKISVALFNISVFNAIKMIVEDNGFEFTYDSVRFSIKKKKIKPPPPLKEPEPEVTYNKDIISIKLDNVDIKSFVKALRKKTDYNILLTPGTMGKLTGELNNIDWKIGLNNILHNNGYDLTMKDSIYYISRSLYFSSIKSENDQPNNHYWINAQNGKVTLDVVGTRLDKIISDLSNQLDLQIIKLDTPNDTVTVRCSRIPIDEAFNYLFKGTEYSYKKENGTYIIGKKDSRNLRNTKLVRLKYLRADKLKEYLPADLTKSASISLSIEHNALVISGNNDEISNIEDYIKTIDQPVPQVLIEALVVDYNLDHIYQLGIKAGIGDSLTIAKPDSWYPYLDVTASGKKINKLLNEIGTLNILGKNIDVAKLGKLPDNFYLNLKALEQNGVANIKSKPILSTINGHTASLKIGTIQNYVFKEILPVTSAVNTTFIEKETIQKIEANISFEITPWVGPNNELTLEIKPEFETPIGPFSPDKNLIPAINTRSLFSTVRLRDGETIVLGGLIQESESSTEDKIPILGDIPLLGELFKNVNKKKSKGELLIYLTPRISYGDNFN